MGELDENMKPVVSMQFLGDEETVKKAMEAVANQGKAKKDESAPEKADAKEGEPKKSEGSETKAEGSETKAEGNETKAEEKGSEGTPESAAAPHTASSRGQITRTCQWRTIDHHPNTIHHKYTSPNLMYNTEQDHNIIMLSLFIIIEIYTRHKHRQ